MGVACFHRSNSLLPEAAATHVKANLLPHALEVDDAFKEVGSG